MNKIKGFENKIICADCLTVMRDMPDNSVDMILTDIPYSGVNRNSSGLRNLNKGDADIVNFDIEDMLKSFIRICKGSFYIFCGYKQISQIFDKLEASSISTRMIIWEKTNPSPMNGEHIYLSGIEKAVYGKKKNATFNGHCLNTVFRFPAQNDKIHPTQKNTKLFKRLIEISSNENDIIFDPFIGSGTTALACVQMNRRFIGIEISEAYCQIARARIEKEKVQLKLLL